MRPTYRYEYSKQEDCHGLSTENDLQQRHSSSVSVRPIIAGQAVETLRKLGADKYHKDKHIWHQREQHYSGESLQPLPEFNERALMIKRDYDYTQDSLSPRYEWMIERFIVMGRASKDMHVSPGRGHQYRKRL